MTPIILIVLAAVWAAVLLPPWLRNRGGMTVMTSFQRQLSSLDRRRGGPSYLPVSSGFAVETDPSHLPLGSRHPVSVDGAPRLVPGAAPADNGHAMVPPDHSASRPTDLRSPAASGAMPTQAATRRHRRRQLLYGLLGAVAVTFLVGTGVGGAAWGVFLLSFVALIAYVVSLIQVQKRAAEREIKVAFLPHTNVGAEPTALLREGIAGR